MGARPNSDSKAATHKEDDGSLWTWGGLGWWQLLKRIWVAIDQDDLYNRAYELAYNFLIAVFPLLLFLMALFGMFAGKGVELRSDLLLYVREIVPGVAYQLLRSTVDEVIQQSGGGKLTFGLLLALYAGSTGTTQLLSTLNIAHGLRETRSWIKVRLVSLALTLVMSMLIIAASLLVLGGGYVAEFLGREIGWSAVFIASWKVALWFGVCYCLLLRSGCEDAPLALDHTGFCDWVGTLAGGLGGAALVSALHYFVQPKLWIAGRGDHLIIVVSRYGIGIPGRSGDQFRHCAGFGRARDCETCSIADCVSRLAW